MPWSVEAIEAIISVRNVPGSWYILVGGIFGSLAGALAERLRHAD